MATHLGRLINKLSGYQGTYQTYDAGDDYREGEKGEGESLLGQHFDIGD